MELINILDKLRQYKNMDWDEAKTKQYIIEPILLALNWDLYDPNIVVPEYTIEIASRKGEKVDYLLQKSPSSRNNSVIIEAKPVREKLTKKHLHQLAGYYPHSEAKLAILTNGYEWMFYSDFAKNNILDSEPFLDINLDNIIEDNQSKLLFETLNYKKLDIDTLLQFGERKKVKEQFSKLLKDQLEDPDEEIIRILIKKYNKTYSENHRLTKQNIDFFKSLFRSIMIDNGLINSQTLPIIIPDVTPPQTYTIKKGYFKNNKGVVSKTGSLKQAWIDYWIKIASNPVYLEKLYELQGSNKYAKNLHNKEIYYNNGKMLGNVKIANDLYIITNLSTEGREKLLNRLSYDLGFQSEIVTEPV